MEPELPEIVAVLARTPSVLRALLQDLPEPWLGKHEGPDAFSPREVVGHLVHGEKTDWVPRLRVILEHGASRPFEPFDRQGYRDADRVPVAVLLDELEGLRRASLAALEASGLTTADLVREGRHPDFGPVTLGQLLATWAVHDLNHIGQIVRVMSAGYVTAVGPWKQYLGILNR
jgi:hypothetical protein